VKARHPEWRAVDYYRLIREWAMLVGIVLMAGFIFAVFILTAVGLYS
jgi:hypothetical protein